MATAPLSRAQTTTHQTYIYIVAQPNPIGVNQQVYLTFLLPNVPPAQLPVANPRFGYWTGITITVTKPDGTTATLTGLQTGEAAAGYTAYTPTQLGTYKFQAFFPGATIESGASKGHYYTPSISPIVDLTVQNETIPPIPEYPLPTSYWTFPIEGENRLWNILGGNWLAGDAVNASTNGYNPYTTAPGSAHILWSQQRIQGGLVGGSYGSDIYNYGRWPASGNGAFFGPPIIINGILYLNEPQYDGDAVGFSAFNLATGETIWKRDDINDSLTFATVYEFKSRMMSNVYDYLWSASGSSWRIYDAFTGKLFQTVANVTSGTRAFGPSGELLIYSLSGTTLRMWNSTLYFYSTTIRSSYGPKYIPNNIWAPDPGTFDFKGGWQWNITVPSGLGSINKIIPNDLLILSRSFSATNTTSPMAQHTGISIKTDLYTGDGSGQQAQVLWGPVNRTLYLDNAGYERIEAVGDGIYVIYKRELLQIVGYDAHTGAQLWITDPFDNAFGLFSGQSNNLIIAEGKVFVGGYDGVMHAYDARTGKLLWQTSVGSSNFETAYGSYPLGGSYDTFKVGGGVLWVGANEHSPSIIPYRNGKIWAFNTTDGTIIWSLLSTLTEVQCPAIVGGMYIYLNGYDGKIYCIGKGPSATTVVGPTTVQPLGTPVLIQGTVTDQSVGAKGTPAISDDSMSAWMEYLYMQKPKPTNASGVQLYLTAIDPNGNWQEIGNAITDTNGNFGITWTPPVEGTYKITSTFSGTESYWGSDAATYIAVNVAPSPSPTATPEPTATPTSTPEPTATPTPTASPSPAPQPEAGPSTDMYIIAAAAVVIIVVVAVAALVLRKRK